MCDKKVYMHVVASVGIILCLFLLISSLTAFMFLDAAVTVPPIVASFIGLSSFILLIIGIAKDRREVLYAFLGCNLTHFVTNIIAVSFMIHTLLRFRDAHHDTAKDPASHWASNYIFPHFTFLVCYALLFSLEIYSCLFVKHYLKKKGGSSMPRKDGGPKRDCK
jgi:hypothetical protein